MKIGRRLSIKLLNASKFVLGFGDTSEGIDPARSPMPLTSRCSTALAICRRGDRSVRWLRLRPVTRTHEPFSGGSPTTTWSWSRPASTASTATSARRRLITLRMALLTLHRLFAPFPPFVTEEVWSWWQDGSIHRAARPTAAELHEPAAGTGSAFVMCHQRPRDRPPGEERGEAQPRTAVLEATFSGRRASLPCSIR